MSIIYAGFVLPPYFSLLNSRIHLYRNVIIQGLMNGLRMKMLVVVNMFNVLNVYEVLTYIGSGNTNNSWTCISLDSNPSLVCQSTSSRKNLRTGKHKKWHPSGGKPLDKHRRRNLSTGCQIVIKSFSSKKTRPKDTYGPTHWSLLSELPPQKMGKALILQTEDIDNQQH